MKQCTILILWSFFFNACFTPHDFKDSRTKILPEKTLNKDSIQFFEPIVLGYWHDYSGANMIYIPGVDRRKDSITRLFTDKMIELYGRRVSISKIHGLFINCFDSLFDNRTVLWQELNLERAQERAFRLDSASIFRCINGWGKGLKLITIFHLRVSEMGYGYSATSDNVECSAFAI